MDSEHFLLILSDSALPIGSFAYSSGLESLSIHEDTNIVEFLEHSIVSVSHTTLPFLRAAYARPEDATEIDDMFDANLPCQVARRSSIAQGRALVKLLDKTFVKHCYDNDLSLLEAVHHYKSSIQAHPAKASGHFGVAFGLAGRILNIELERLVQAFVHAHAKAVLSAAVRLSIIGPYESTDILSSSAIRDVIQRSILETRELDVNSSGQTYSLLDIYQGRHELLYSRIFSA